MYVAFSHLLVLSQRLVLAGASAQLMDRVTQSLSVLGTVLFFIPFHGMKMETDKNDVFRSPLFIKKKMYCGIRWDNCQ